MRFSAQAPGIVRLRGVAEVTFRGSRSTLCVLDVWTCKFSWQVPGAGNREVASCGGGECRCDIGIGV